MELFCGSQMFEMFIEQRKKNLFSSSAFEKRVSMDKLQSNLKHLLKDKGQKKKILGTIPLPSFNIKSKKSTDESFVISKPTFVSKPEITSPKDNNNNNR